jgi:hypothetical protein
LLLLLMLLCCADGFKARPLVLLLPLLLLLLLLLLLVVVLLLLSPLYLPALSSCRRVLMTSIGCRQQASMVPPMEPGSGKQQQYP